MLESELLTLLRCPACGSPLSPSKNAAWLYCLQEQKAYPIIDHIPILRVDRAQAINDSMETS